MPLGLRWGTVSAVRERLDGLVRLEVDGGPCIAYPRLTGEVEEGDVVLVNTQARELDLGSGGFDVLYANLTRGLGAPAGGRGARHGAPVRAGAARDALRRGGRADETSAPERVDGLPVVCLGLHSQLAPVCAALAGRRVAYVQLAGGALPVSLSDTVRALKARRLRRDRDRGLAVPRRRPPVRHRRCGADAGGARGAEVVVCGIGPGIVGTGSRWGHGGLAVAEAANVASALGAQPIVAARVSFGDDVPATTASRTTRARRSRSASARCASPGRAGSSGRTDVEVVEVDATGGKRPARRSRSRTWAAGPAEDPWFFAAAFAAGRLAAA